ASSAVPTGRDTRIAARIEALAESAPSRICRSRLRTGRGAPLFVQTGGSRSGLESATQSAYGQLCGAPRGAVSLSGEGSDFGGRGERVARGDRFHGAAARMEALVVSGPRPGSADRAGVCRPPLSCNPDGESG